MNPSHLAELESVQAPNGERVLHRRGRFLCSPRDPVREARDWMSRQKIRPDDQTIVVLGLGAGHHVTLLRQHFPKMKILVGELHQATAELTKSFWITHNQDYKIQVFGDQQIEALSAEKIDLVLNFRPAWAGFEAQYMKLFFALTQSTAQSFADRARALNLSLIQHSVETRPPDINFCLKDIEFAAEFDGQEEVQIWRTLRELFQ